MCEYALILFISWLISTRVFELLFVLSCSYALGSVFLQLLKVLRLEEHPIVRKLVDPSLFIYKFTHSKYHFKSYSFHIPLKYDWYNVVNSVCRIRE